MKFKFPQVAIQKPVVHHEPVIALANKAERSPVVPLVHRPLDDGVEIFCIPGLGDEKTGQTLAALDVTAFAVDLTNDVPKGIPSTFNTEFRRYAEHQYARSRALKQIFQMANADKVSVIFDGSPSLRKDVPAAVAMLHINAVGRFMQSVFKAYDSVCLAGVERSPYHNPIWRHSREYAELSPVQITGETQREYLTGVSMSHNLRWQAQCCVYAISPKGRQLLDMHLPSTIPLELLISNHLSNLVMRNTIFESAVPLTPFEFVSGV